MGTNVLQRGDGRQAALPHSLHLFKKEKERAREREKEGERAEVKYKCSPSEDDRA